MKKEDRRNECLERAIQLESEIADSTARLRNTRKLLRETMKTLASTKKTLDSLQQKHKLLKEELDAIKDELESVELELEKVNKKLNKYKRIESMRSTLTIIGIVRKDESETGDLSKLKRGIRLRKLSEVRIRFSPGEEAEKQTFSFTITSDNQPTRSLDEINSALHVDKPWDLKDDNGKVISKGIYKFKIKNIGDVTEFIRKVRFK